MLKILSPDTLWSGSLDNIKSTRALSINKNKKEFQTNSKLAFGMMSSNENHTLALHTLLRLMYFHYSKSILWSFIMIHFPRKLFQSKKDWKTKRLTIIQNWSQIIRHTENKTWSKAPLCYAKSRAKSFVPPFRPQANRFTFKLPPLIPFSRSPATIRQPVCVSVCQTSAKVSTIKHRKLLNEYKLWWKRWLFPSSTTPNGRALPGNGCNLFLHFWFIR